MLGPRLQVRPILAALALGAGLSGCGSTCDDLVAALAECVGDVGASDTETTNERTDDLCDADEEACAACILASKIDLCTDYGDALAACRASGECAE